MENGSYVGYIYMITNMLNNKKYIGQTIRSIKRRWQSHQTEAKKETNPSYLHRAILKYGADNFKIETIDILTKKSKKELKNGLNNLEIFYINKYNTIRPNGYNITPGGDTSSLTRRRKIVQLSKRGEIINVFESIADATRKIGLSEGALSSVLGGYTKMAYGYYWKYFDDKNLQDFIKSIYVPYIAMYNKDGLLERVYDDYRKASLDNDIKVTRVKQCCNGERTHSKNKRFREYSDINKIPDKIEKLVINWGKKIYQFDLDGKLIDEYKNISDLLEKYPEYKPTTIRNCCTGNRQTAYNYIWKYA